MGGFVFMKMKQNPKTSNEFNVWPSGLKKMYRDSNFNYHMCEKSESPSRAWSGLENTEFDIVRQAWASGQIPGCRGTHLRSLNLVCIVPIMDNFIFSGFWAVFGTLEATTFFSFSCFFKASFCFLQNTQESTFGSFRVHVSPYTRVHTSTSWFELWQRITVSILHWCLQYHRREFPNHLQTPFYVIVDR